MWLQADGGEAAHQLAERERRARVGAVESLAVSREVDVREARCRTDEVE